MLWFSCRGQAKQLDPTRLVNTADGVFGDHTASSATIQLTNPQDFRSAGFASTFHHHTLPIVDPTMFRIDGVPPVPVIDHEMGNFVSWPVSNSSPPPRSNSSQFPSAASSVPQVMFALKQVLSFFVFFNTAPRA